MTREEEIRAAIDKIFPCTNEGRCYEQAIAVSGFELGVKWADKHPANVWHSSDEEPQDGTHILMEYGSLASKELKSYNISYDGYVNWDILKKYFRVLRWAYIKDVLPKGGEE